MLVWDIFIQSFAQLKRGILFKCEYFGDSKAKYTVCYFVTQFGIGALWW